MLWEVDRHKSQLLEGEDKRVALAVRKLEELSGLALARMVAEFVCPLDLGKLQSLCVVLLGKLRDKALQGRGA